MGGETDFMIGIKYLKYFPKEAFKLPSGLTIYESFFQGQLDWDDPIPEDLREIWNSNFEMIQGMKELTYRRAVVPDDAISLDIETLDFADASTQSICVVVYPRFKRKNGNIHAN